MFVALFTLRLKKRGLNLCGSSGREGIATNNLIGRRGVINSTFSPNVPHRYKGRKFTVTGKSHTPGCVMIRFDGNKTSMPISVTFLDIEKDQPCQQDT